MAADLRPYLTGATLDGGAQSSPALSLGGYRSATPAGSLEVVRGVSLRNVRIDYAPGAIGPGYGTLVAATDDTLQFAAPGDDYGTAVTIANGETKVVASASGRKYVLVTRTSADAMIGREELIFLDQYEGIARRFTSAEATAGESIYRAIMLRNDGDESVSPLLYLRQALAAEFTAANALVADTAWLGASGAGTVETTTDLDAINAPGFGYVLLFDTTTEALGGVNYPDTLLECCYYTRAGSVLTVAAAHRAQLGTSETTGVENGLFALVPGLRFAWETPSADAIQIIADETTAPSGVTWSVACCPNLSEAAPSIAAGAMVGLWIEINQPTDAEAAARILWRLMLRSTTSVVETAATSDVREIRDLIRVADDGLDQYEIYVGVNAAPDLTAAPDEVFTSRPSTVSTIGWTGPNTYRLLGIDRNAYGLAGIDIEETVIELDGDGEVVATRPSGPQITQISASRAGKFLIEARYFPEMDGAVNRADTWLIYLSTDGTTPDPSADAPIEVTMQGIAAAASVGGGQVENLIYYTTSGYLDGTPGKVIVQTRRTYEVDEIEYTIDSTNATVYTATAATLGPAIPSGFAAFGRADAAPPSIATVDTDPVYIDEANDIYWIGDADGISLYAGTGVLVWRWRWATMTLHVPNTWTIDGTTTISGSGSGAVDVISWTGGDKRLGINVGGTRVAVIDVTNTTIYVGGSSAFLGGTTTAQVPAFARFDETLFQAWRAATEQMETYAHVDADGVLSIDGGTIDMVNLDQSGIEAL